MVELIPGSKVKLISTGEVGVVIHCWENEDMGEMDCHIAFYGKGFPLAKPTETPYVLRYLESSLERVDG